MVVAEHRGLVEVGESSGIATLIFVPPYGGKATVMLSGGSYRSTASTWSPTSRSRHREHGLGG